MNVYRRKDPWKNRKEIRNIRQGKNKTLTNARCCIGPLFSREFFRMEQRRRERSARETGQQSSAEKRREDRRREIREQSLMIQQNRRRLLNSWVSFQQEPHLSLACSTQKAAPVIACTWQHDLQQKRKEKPQLVDQQGCEGLEVVRRDHLRQRQNRSSLLKEEQQLTR
jgi:hypothetical protein